MNSAHRINARWITLAGLASAALSLGACSAGDETGGASVRRPGAGEPGTGQTQGPTGTTPVTPSTNEATNAALLPDTPAPEGDPNCGLITFNVERRPTDVLLVFDRSGSMQDAPDGATATTSKWDLTVPALKQVVNETNAGVAWGMKLFPEGQDTDSCTPATISDTIHVPIAAGNAAAVVQAIDATGPDGDGTPTGAAIEAATRYLAAQQTQNDRYILLATDGEPSCDATPDEDSEAARTYAVSAVTQAAAQGFKVFVVGVATTKDTATKALNDMALAGGVPRPDPNPLATRYYLANTQNDLVNALRAITSEIASCVFPLSMRPPVPNNIGIKVDGVLVPRDGSRQNGWEYTSADLTALEVYGPACDQIQATARDVQVIYACEGVIIR